MTLLAMDGVLLIDKPTGPTSHDVVARLRRVLRVRGIGHTGTLDPLASGLLPLVIGRATRLASLLTGSDKTYDATIRLGFGTDTDDAQGTPIGPRATHLPDDELIARALDAFRGSFEQVPPSHSAKRVAGTKAYELARQSQEVVLKPVTVTVRALDWVSRVEDLVTVQVEATAGFYVRGLARDLGRRLGCGAHLSALRRTRSGGFRVEDAVTLEEAERLGLAVAGRIVSPAAALPYLQAVSVTALGRERALHGNVLSAGHLATGAVATDGTAWVKVLGLDGELIALARWRGDVLHPAVVLG